MVLADGELDGHTLGSAVAGLAGDADSRRAMGQAARTLALPDAAARIADVAEELLGGRPKEDRDVS